MQQELVEKIRQAFADAPYPGDGGEIGHWEVDSFIGQKDWIQVPLELLVWHVTDIPLFSVKGFHFYMPAFLSAALLHPEKEGFASEVIMNLLPYSSSNKHLLSQRIKVFNNIQKGVVVEYLKAFPQIFPDSEYSKDDRGQLELEDGIRFWQSEVS